MRVVDLIEKKRDGGALTAAEIEFLIAGYVAGKIPDYQISAFLMATFFRGLTEDEVLALTQAMLASGDQLDLRAIDGICVDKHSTGGVGDTTTLIVAPLVACCGLRLAKMSGRGLGHTGGTLDKLESIPGFAIDLTPERFFKQVNEIGLAVAGQTANITPADKLLYALRDVTGTVNIEGLIASSIMAKKLASGAETIILDVKVGDGAFMKTRAAAAQLARLMVKIGNSCGRKTIALLSNMDEPLGMAIGNSLEVAEALDVLKGAGPRDLKELSFALTSELLQATGLAPDPEAAYALINKQITSGAALAKFAEFVAAQGGDPAAISDPQRLPQAKTVLELVSPASGYLQKIDTAQIGRAAMILGAGREEKQTPIDPAVGIKVVRKVGDYVKKGLPIAYLYTNGKGTEEARAAVLAAFHFSEEAVEKLPIVLEIIK